MPARSTKRRPRVTRVDPERGAEAAAVYCYEFNPEDLRTVARPQRSAPPTAPSSRTWLKVGEGSATSWDASWRFVGTLGTAARDGERPPIADLPSGREE